MSTEDPLSQFEQQFAEASAERAAQDRVPNGTYIAVIEKLAMEVSRTDASKEVLQWQFRILAPRFAKRKLWKRSGFTANSIPYLKQELAVAGLILEKLVDLRKRSHEAEGHVVEVKVADDGEPKFYKVFVNRRIADSLDDFRAANPDAEMAAKENDDVAAAHDPDVGPVNDAAAATEQPF